jgi:predicted acylesterase/phospholipase RssA
MSGGSNNGAWEIGVLWGLAHYGNPADFYWDVISGISAGAINTSGTAGWKPEEVLEMTEYMSDAWLNISTDDIWVARPGIQHILNEPSIFDDSSALETIREIMSVRTEFGRRVSVSCADANTGDFIEFNQNNTNYYDFGQAGLSSGSIPVVFPPQLFQGHTCMDGGTVWNVNIDSAIN